MGAMITTLPGPRPVVALESAAGCVVDGFPWPASAPPLATLRRRWPRHLHGALAAAVARIGSGVRPARPGSAPSWLSGRGAPSAPGWWIVDLGGRGFDALWADVIVDDGAPRLGWWWASAPGCLVTDGAWWPETVWTGAWRAAPLEVALGGRGPRGLTGARAVLARLDERQVVVVEGAVERQVVGGEALAAV